jgi:hypothetical protein
MIMIEDNFCPGQTSKFSFRFGDEMERFSWSLIGGEFAVGSNQYSENPAVNWYANSGTIRIDGYFCDGGTTKLFWQEESYEMTTGTVSADEDECLPMVRLEYSGSWDEIDHWERSTSSSNRPLDSVQLHAGFPDTSIDQDLVQSHGLGQGRNLHWGNNTFQCCSGGY